MTALRQAAVLGRPIEHSLSPLLHTAAYAALGLRWQYSAIDCGTSELEQVLAERSGWAGFSCTMPLKRLVLQVADEVSPLARQVGAGNTLLPLPDGGWRAENTDVAGIVATLREGAAGTDGVTVLGAGGTAQAVLAALVQLGVPGCTILVRDAARTAQVRSGAEVLGLALEVGSLSAQSPALDAELIISSLPAGAADPLAARSWRANQAVLDVVYDPWPTVLAAAVARSGGTVLSGGLLLLHQAAAQVELMTGLQAPLEAMRRALRVAAPAARV